MKKISKKIIFTVFVIVFLFMLVSCKNNNNTNNDKQYDIYLLAVNSGYSGTYEDWLLTIKGEKRDTGDKGPKGDKGETGAKGETGDQGPKGDKGETGEQGSKGENGLDGLNGEDGKSAYELHVEKFGYEGSELEWLNDLLNGNLVEKELLYVDFYDNLEGYTKIERVNVYKDDKVIAPVVEKDNHIFAGWHLDGLLFDTNAAVITKNISLRAKWEPIYYPIYTVDDLINMDLSKSYILMNDIDLENIAWTPIEMGGYLDTYLSFDGNGYKILNLNIIEPNLEYYGLFGDFRNASGVIKNLTLENVTIDISSDKANLYVGALYGRAKDRVIVENVKGINININVNSTSGYSVSVGGLFGSALYSITGKYLYAEGIININALTDVYVGGIYGRLDGSSKQSFLRSKMNINIITEKNINVGGIIGRDYIYSNPEIYYYHLESFNTYKLETEGFIYQKELY